MGIIDNIKRIFKSKAFNKAIISILGIAIEIYCLGFAIKLGGAFWDYYRYITMGIADYSLPTFWFLAILLIILMIAVAERMITFWLWASSENILKLQQVLNCFIDALFLTKLLVLLCLTIGLYNLPEIVNELKTSHDDDPLIHDLRQETRTLFPHCMSQYASGTCSTEVYERVKLILLWFFMVTSIPEFMLNRCVRRLRVLNDIISKEPDAAGIYA